MPDDPRTRPGADGAPTTPPPPLTPPGPPPVGPDAGPALPEPSPGQRGGRPLDPADPASPTDASTPADPSSPGAAATAASTPEAGPGFAERAAESGRRFLTIAAFAAGAVVAVLIGWFMFGEWWIGVVRSTVDGNAFAGFAFGFSIGFITTALTVICLRLVLLRHMPGAARIVLGALAAVPLAPLIFSLRIALNKSGDRPGSLEYQMMVDGRGYQSGVATGALIAAVIALGVSWWWWDRRRRRRIAATTT